MKLTPIIQATLTNTSVKDSELIHRVCTSMLSLYEINFAVKPWLGYLCSANKFPNQFIGTCAFKGNPIKNRVEIAYFTFPGFENMGYATQMVLELIKIATTAEKNIEVFAQTLGEKNASNHILQKCGFTFAGEIMHPEDGLVWEWQR